MECTLLLDNHLTSDYLKIECTGMELMALGLPLRPSYQWFNPRVKILEEQGHDPTDLHKAIDRGYGFGD